MKDEHDRLFSSEQPRADFVFDEKVAAVFTDMINRSVPGYATILSMIGMLAQRYCQQNSRIYDLGCSLGGATLAMAYQIPHANYRLIGVDNSEAMIRRFRHSLDQDHSEFADRIELNCADINEFVIEDASVVVLNFTLQFIPVARRNALLKRICDGLRPGGVLVLSEKIRFPEAELNELFIDMYHQFKQARGYSELEISRKRSALENVLIPESIHTHKTRLREAGFRSCDVWFQCFNFASLAAFK